MAVRCTHQGRLLGGERHETLLSPHPEFQLTHVKGAVPGQLPATRPAVPARSPRAPLLGFASCLRCGSKGACSEQRVNMGT